MGETYQASAPGLSRTSKTTQVLVVAYHLLVAVFVTGALLLEWLAGIRSQDDRFLPEAMSLIAGLFVLLYFTTAWGILRWKNWSRSVALVLNWINVVAAVLNLRRIWIEGVVSVLLSCLVLWWLSKPAVKLGFRRGNLAA